MYCHSLPSTCIDYRVDSVRCRCRTWSRSFFHWDIVCLEAPAYQHRQPRIVRWLSLYYRIGRTFEKLLGYQRRLFFKSREVNLGYRLVLSFRRRRFRLRRSYGVWCHGILFKLILRSGRCDRLCRPCWLRCRRPRWLGCDRSCRPRWSRCDIRWLGGSDCLRWLGSSWKIYT